MSLGTHLSMARRKTGLSQEAVAETLGVSRQTISKWETDETQPDIRQCKRLAVLYGVTLDELIDFDVTLRQIQEVIDRTSEESASKIDWTKAWSKKYPILAQYQSEVDVPRYAQALERLLCDLEQAYHYDRLNAMLVLKDILAQVWNSRP